MLINQITESTIDNLNLLKQIADIIIDHLPDTIKKEDEFILTGYELMDDIMPIFEKYKNTKYKNSIVKVVSTDYRISNKEEYMFKTKGYYAASKSIIGINLSGILNNSINLTKEKIKQNKIIASVIIHELRHLFQFSEYPEFYKKDLKIDNSGLEKVSPEKINDELKKRKEEKYRKMKIEIDAAWTHMLNQFDDGKNSVDVFVKRVMDELKYYKDLTPKQIEHYRRKTARYYFDKRNSSYENN
jgi:hypothetical protein